MGDESLLIQKRKQEAVFSGINGPPMDIKERWNVFGFLGAGTGLSAYDAAVEKDSDLVSLLCLRSIKQGPGVIHTVLPRRRDIGP